MRVTYDAKRGLGYIYLTGTIEPGGVAETIPVSDTINLDFDQDGRLIGVELLAGDLLHPDLKAIAERPGPK